MDTPASIRKHPIHPMLIVFPIALWIFSLACDVIYHAGSHDPLWKTMAFYSMAGGVIGALLAAIPGFIDYLSLRDRRAKTVATVHMVLNLIVVGLFIFNLGLRYRGLPSSDLLAVALSVVGIAAMAVSGWFGGALVYELRVGVSPAPPEQRDLGRRAA
jgi:uncharacterized membrane protein